MGRDRSGDLLTLNSSGAFTFQQGTGTGTFSGKTSASGWPTSAAAVPFGTGDDQCNSVLVRLGSGELRDYRAGCGALKPSTPYTSLGTGWNAYDSLTAPGDLTGDSRPDLLARNESTGDIYLFAGAERRVACGGQEDPYGHGPPTRGSWARETSTAMATAMCWRGTRPEPGTATTARGRAC